TREEERQLTSTGPTLLRRSLLRASYLTREGRRRAALFLMSTKGAWRRKRPDGARASRGGGVGARASRGGGGGARASRGRGGGGGARASRGGGSNARMSRGGGERASVRARG
uniref:Uncharacterized protein n=1 Tax=Aegilops tauschii subsp. strangulata TaxID=200361 RepID=A0A452ZVB2_AEGTS